MIPNKLREGNSPVARNSRPSKVCAALRAREIGLKSGTGTDGRAGRFFRSKAVFAAIPAGWPGGNKASL